MPRAVTSTAFFWVENGGSVRRDLNPIYNSCYGLAPKKINPLVRPLLSAVLTSVLFEAA
jgi:hypothetical protein